MGSRWGWLSVICLAVVCGLASPAEAATGAVWAWGDNESGDLGDNSTYVRRAPVPVHTLTSVKAIAAGAYHSLALRTDGTVWAWGDNESGALGDNSLSDRREPVQVRNLGGAVGLSGGAFHSLARRNDGTVRAWGDGAAGQLANNSRRDRLEPVQAHGLTGVLAIAAGDLHSLALEDDGTLWASGGNGLGQLGDNSATDRLEPVQVHNLAGVAAVGAGAYHSLAVKSDGTAWAWGANDSGQLGDGSTTLRPEPVPVATLTAAVAVAAGAGHSLALKGDGTVWAWGANAYGQLGDGTATDRSTPVPVRNLTGVIAIAAGDNHSLALKNDGTVWAWGHNGYGQLGDNSVSNRFDPVQVANLIGVTAIAAGGSHSLALTGTGLPDLQGYACNAPRSAFWGQAINVGCQIQNAGTGSAGSFRVEWWLSQNPIGSTTDDLLLSRTNGNGTYYSHGSLLAKAIGAPFTVGLILPAALPSGWGGTRFYVIMRTDSLDAVTESNEGNNFGQVGDGLDRDPITIGTAVPEVTYPTLPDEVWQRGKSHTVTWAQFLATSVRVELYKTGVFNRTIASSTPNNGAYAWTVPTGQAIGSDYAVKVTSTANAALTASSDNPLTIADATLTYPTGSGVTWLGGKNYTIAWSGLPDAAVNVDLYKSGSFNRSIAAATPNTGSVGWTVPADQAPGTDYTVKVSSPTNPNLADESGQPFTIATPQVTYPTDAGVTWLGGNLYTITWTGYPGSNVKIELYKGTSLSRTIASAAGNTGSFPWTVVTSQAAGLDYTVRITSTANSSVVASSAKAFTIAVPKVTYPTAAGVVLKAGQLATIKWSGYPDAVTIETYQGAALADTAAASAPNTGSFAYALPKTLVPDTNYTIKITSTTNALVTDSSDNPFTVTAP